MILIVSFENNQHVQQVTQFLKVPFRIVDIAWFPTTLKMHAGFYGLSEGLFLTLPSREKIPLNDVGAVWQRRVRGMIMDPTLTDPTAQQFAWSESTEALQGLWDALDCYWMNPLLADERSSKKVAQLRIAKEVGLTIPETLVTNCPEEAKTFAERHMQAGVIRKAFRNLPEAPRETLRLSPQHLAQLDAVRFAPVIFQEYIPLALDLRVTVVDGEIFTAAFKSDPAYEVDYRSGIGTAVVSDYNLPDDIANKLLQLMDRFDLRFGAVDFRVTPDGRYVFFEVNPAGEYLFVTERTGLPIPQAIAAALSRHVK